MLCIGDRLSGLGGRIGAALAEAPLRRCRLQMMQTAPAAERICHRHRRRRLDAVLPRLRSPRPGLTPRPPAPRRPTGPCSSWWSQRAGGGLTIGDTHVYEEPFDFAVDESLYDNLRARAESILGWELPPVVRRWAGVYTVVDRWRHLLPRRIEPAVWVVTGPAGRGMTLSPAIAEQTWDEVMS